MIITSGMYVQYLIKCWMIIIQVLWSYFPRKYNFIMGICYLIYGKFFFAFFAQDIPRELQSLRFFLIFVALEDR